MPWYKVPLVAYLEAEGPEEARQQALGRADVPPHGPLWEAAPAAEMTPRHVEALLRLRAHLDQARADLDAGLWVEDPAHPGVRFAPGAAAQLAALEFEEQQEI